MADTRSELDSRWVISEGFQCSRRSMKTVVLKIEDLKKIGDGHPSLKASSSAHSTSRVTRDVVYRSRRKLSVEDLKIEEEEDWNR